MDIYLSLTDRFNIKIEPCNVICKLADKSEVKITQCCNLDLSIEMKNSPMIRINCRFLIMESSQDLVLGWEAIKRFNLMQVNVANILPQTDTNLMKSKIKKCKFNDDGIQINIISDNYINTELARIDINLKGKSCLRNSIDLISKNSINDMRPNTLKQLLSFNTQVNQHSKYLGNDIQFELDALNRDWYRLHVDYGENSVVNNVCKSSKNTIFCNTN